jgi:hypothetical protein
MDRRISAVALLAAVSLAACSPDLVAPVMTPSSPSFSKSVAQSNRHIVVLNGNGKADRFAAQVKALGGNVVSYHEGAGIAVVSGLSATAAADLGSTGTVQPDIQISLNLPAASMRADVSEVANEGIDSQANPATGVRYFFQWNMRHINAPAAWAAGKLGSSSVSVAILDTGLDYDNRDLTGLVDLSRSKSFMDTFVGSGITDKTDPDFTPTVPADDALIATWATGAHPITDFNGHGTNVATQVSSKAFALAGVTSKTTLIGVKVLGANGYGSFSDIMNGVLHAADVGADVANMSLGGGFSKSGAGQYVATINRVFNYARKKGMLVVVSAGNAEMDLQHSGNFNANYCDAPHVMCVSAVGPTTATGNADTAAFYTNFGQNSVDIAAPGGNVGFDKDGNAIVSTWPWGPHVASFVWSFCARRTLAISIADATDPKNFDGKIALGGCEGGGSLTGNIGTSQASPHVAGLAALLISENASFKGNPDKIKKHIVETAAPINAALGRGRIDVKAALGL